LAALLGLTAAYGSTSALRYSTPPSAPPLQLMEKGVSAEIRTGLSPTSGGRTTAGGGVGAGAGAGGGAGATLSDPPPQAVNAAAITTVENVRRRSVIGVAHGVV